jgi:hypothetical protein
MFPIMATLKIKRRFEIFGMFKTYQVFINDNVAFNLGNNKIIELDLNNFEPNTKIFAKCNGFKSNEIIISNLSENKQLEIYTFKYINLFGVIYLFLIASAFLFEIPVEYYAYMLLFGMLALLLSHFVNKNKIIKLVSK